MPTLVWDQVGEKVYETGVDRGVLYPKEGPAVAWNGLTGVDDSTSGELKSFYLDGAKYLETLSPGDYEGKLKAYTYPDAFDAMLGVANPSGGIRFHEQKPKKFDLTYRTRVGNDLEGTDHGYKIHLLYNILAKPDSSSFETLTDSANDPVEFGWGLTGTPVAFPGMRPTVHLSIDSTTADPDSLATLEDILYGTEDDDARMPTATEVALAFGYIGGLVITDHGDGTWTASDMGTPDFPAFITMTDATTFAIDHADVDILDPDTYEISDTAVGWDA